MLYPKLRMLKYLGVVLDNKLSWKLHISQVKKQISKACGALSRLRYYLPVNSLIAVCYLFSSSACKKYLGISFGIPT